MTLLEVCVDSLEAAFEASARGAERLEFCAQLELGGVTPREEDLRRVVEGLEVPVVAMVRPRAGDFVMSGTEVGRMLSEIDMARRAGAAGVVLGVLTSSGSIDESALQSLVERAGVMPVTFHRAFDGIASPLEALDTLIRHGVARLLTSGDGASAWEGRELLRKLVAHAGDSLVVMPGGGVRTNHVRELIEFTGAKEVHSSQVVDLQAPHD